MLFRSVVIDVNKGDSESKLHKQVDQSVKPKPSNTFGGHCYFDRDTVYTL